MQIQLLPKSLLILTLGILAVPVAMFFYPQTTASAQGGYTAGALTVTDAEGNPKAMCPLKHTDVKAEISGFISRVVVTQQFENPFKEKIEAVYTFPLPQNAAVDDMTMTVGERTIRGKILPREEAQAVYDAAKSSGKVASLLDQERPNIFTQSVANILPGDQIKITISYVETLNYVNGAYEFVFPMVVGPRYVPGSPTGQKQGNGFAPDTNRVPDASRITPNSPPPAMRSGHDISLDVALDAGLVLDDINSKTHDVNIQRPDAHSARLHLREGATIPNKDFVLRYDVAGQAIQDALITHRSEKGGYFTLILQPPDRITAEDVTPKELVFVLDTSGSMEGFPIEKAKETMKLALDSLYPSDTFNLITFAGDTHILFPKAVPATPANLNKARLFLGSRSGSGGTEMMTAIKAALEPSDDQSHIRIVCFMTDGYVGNDMEIISEVQKHPNARVFSFGIGSSVNRFLLDKMAEAGRGEVEYVALNDDGSAAARRFHERVRNPLLTDISIDWNNLPVADVYPQRIPDLFGAKPLILKGRFTSAGRGTIRLKGKMGGSDFVRDIPVELPETMALHDVLAPMWARARVESLMNEDYEGAQTGNMRAELKDTITQLGIEYRLMTQFTSFVAVEEMVVTDGGQPRRIDVPVEVPQGVKVESVDDISTASRQSFGYMTNSPPKVASVVVSRARVAGAGGGGAGAGAGPGRGANMGAQPSAPMGISTADPAQIATRQQLIDKKQSENLRPKLHRSLLAVVAKLQRKETLSGADEGGFIRNGKAEVQVWLTDKSPTSLAKLKELGFEVVLDSQTSKLIIGRISLDKLETLGRLSFVKYVSPQTSK
ncbi:MAG TPA: VIT and VWA domain-containing protein [Pyrinomonadaceae bacterium]|jgi:Ca-activated chloride channel family protein|nr:VIT and VWA domain-containing protein [Pyrinomonadaceae bacterium]